MPDIVAFRQPEARSTVAVVIAAVIAIRVASAGAAKDFISPSVSLVISAAVGVAPPVSVCFPPVVLIRIGRRRRQ